MNNQIFISYRRKDSEGVTGRIYDRLKIPFTERKLFIDVDNISPGQNFRKAVQEKVSECDILLAIVGPQWLNIKDINGNRRIDDPEDLVRAEISSALNRNIHILPVLIGNALMPDKNSLPVELKPFSDLNAIEISHSRFDSDIQRLTKSISEILKIIGAEKDRSKDNQVKLQKEIQIDSVNDSKKNATSSSIRSIDDDQTKLKEKIILATGTSATQDKKYKSFWDRIGNALVFSFFIGILPTAIIWGVGSEKGGLSNQMAVLSAALCFLLPFVYFLAKGK